MDPIKFQNILNAAAENPMMTFAPGPTDIEEPIETESGGGMVKVTIDTEGLFSSIVIDPLLLDKENVHHLEQLLKAAINNARAQFQIELNKLARDQIMDQLPNKDQLGSMVSDVLSKFKP